jgi:hypothetical protein
MDHSVSVGFGEGACDLHGDVDSRSQGKGAAQKLLRESFSLVVGHHDEGTAVVGLLNAVNDTDIRMIERRGSAGFPYKPVSIDGLSDDVVRKKFQRDSALQLKVERPVNHTHAARARKTKNLVIANAVACG